MKQLYNNGYVVMALAKNLISSSTGGFCGVDSYVSWPLKEYDDNLSRKLENEAWDKWFGFVDVLEVVPNRDYLIRYINHCETIGIKTIILQIETPRNSQIATDYLEVTKVLGFDCIEGVQLSYLNLLPSYMRETFPKTYHKLNSNGLCDNIDDVYEFLDTYNIMLLQGANLEHGSNPTPAKLSVVKL